MSFTSKNVYTGDKRLNTLKNSSIMIKNTLTPTIKYITVFLSLLLAGNIHAAQQVLTDDGNEVLLNDDGSWVFQSSDRFANTNDGRRVRLKEDGSWTYTANAPLNTDVHSRTSALDIKLQQVVVETHEKKVQKNTRVKTQTVFHLSLKYSPLDDRSISLKNDDINLIEVKDNNGKIYPVVSIQPASTLIQANTEINIVVRVKKSPLLLDDVKSMTVTFKAGIFELQTPISLNQKVDDFDKKKVSGF